MTETFGTHSALDLAAAFILAPQAPTTTLTAEGRVKPLNPLHLLNPHARQGVSMQAPTTTLTAEGRVSRVDGIRLLCPPLTEPYLQFSRIRLLE